MCYIKKTTVSTGMDHRPGDRVLKNFQKGEGGERFERREGGLLELRGWQRRGN